MHRHHNTSQHHHHFITYFMSNFMFYLWVCGVFFFLEVKNLSISVIQPFTLFQNCQISASPWPRVCVFWSPWHHVCVLVIMASCVYVFWSPWHHVCVFWSPWHHVCVLVTMASCVCSGHHGLVCVCVLVTMASCVCSGHHGPYDEN